MAGLLKAIGEVLWAPFDLAKEAVKDDPFLSGLLKGCKIWKDPDHAKTTAENTQKIIEALSKEK